MNLVFSQSPAPAPSRTPAPAQEASPADKPFDPQQARKSFSSVLHAVRQEGQDDLPGKSSSAQGHSPARAQSDSREAGRPSGEQQTSDASDAKRPDSDTAKDQTKDSGRSESAGLAEAGKEEDHDTSTDKADAPSDMISQGMLLALLQTPAPNQTTQQLTSKSKETDQADSLGLSSTDSVKPATVQKALLAGTAPTVPPPMATEPSETGLVVPATETLPTAPKAEAAPLSDSRLVLSVPISSSDQSQEQPDLKLASSKPEKTEAPKSFTDAPTEAPPQPTNVPVQRPTESSLQATDSEKASLLLRPAAEAEIRPVREQQTLRQKQDAPLREPSAKEEPDDQSLPARAQSWPLFAQGDSRPEAAFFDKDHEPHQRGEMPFNQSAPVGMDSHQNPSTAAAWTVGPSTQAAPSQTDTRPATAATQVPTITAPSEPQASSLPTFSKSVVFEVGEPDLGRVQVRVAMTNEVVHTHFTSDRPDIGTQLVNGQDRLQSALQASGLDMGQFRVQVDRQGTQHGGQEWLSRGYDERPQQQRENHRQQEQSTDSLPKDRQQAGALSLFA